MLVLNVDIRSNNHLVLVKHLDHILGDTEEGVERTAEGIETALQSLDHVNTIDACQHGGNMKSSRILLASLALQELHGTIAGIVQALAFGIILRMRRICKNRHRTIEEIVQTAIQFIHQFVGRQDIGEYDVLIIQVFLVGRHILDIVSGSSDRHLVNYLRSYLLIEVFGTLGKFGISFVLLVQLTLAHQLIIFFYPWREGYRQILDAFDGGITGILEEKQEIQKIGRAIVERSSRKQHHLLVMALYQTFVNARSLAD